MQLVDAREFTVARGVELLAPAAQLPVEEAVGAAEVAQAHGPGIDGVQIDERVDQSEDRRPGALGAEGASWSALRYGVPSTNSMT